MPFDDAELVMYTNATGQFVACNDIQVYYRPVPHVDDYWVHANRPYESLNGGPAFPDRPFSTGDVTRKGKAWVADLSFDSDYTDVWCQQHFAQNRKIRIWMDLPDVHSDEPLKLTLRCEQATLVKRALLFVKKVISEITRACWAPLRLLKRLTRPRRRPEPPQMIHPKHPEKKDDAA